MEELLRIACTLSEQRVLLAVAQNPHLAKSNKFKTIARDREHTRVLRWLMTHHPSRRSLQCLGLWTNYYPLILDTYTLEEGLNKRWSAFGHLHTLRRGVRVKLSEWCMTTIFMGMFEEVYHLFKTIAHEKPTRYRLAMYWCLSDARQNLFLWTSEQLSQMIRLLIIGRVTNLFHDLIFMSIGGVPRSLRYACMHLEEFDQDTRKQIDLVHGIAKELGVEW